MCVNPILRGLFRAAQGWNKQKASSLPKFHYRRTTMMKCGRGIPWVKKTQKIKPIEFGWHKRFSPKTINFCYQNNINVIILRYLRHFLRRIRYKNWILYDVTKFISILPTFWLTQQPSSRTRCWLKSALLVLKESYQNKPEKKSNVTRLKSTRC